MSHTYSRMLVHVVFSTKHREPSIRADIRSRLYEYMAGIARKEFGFALNIGGTEDHVHGLLALNTNVCVADAMRKWKSLSSGWMHKTFDDAAEFAWQTGYGAFSVSESNVDQVAQYILNQQQHHKRITFQDEFIAFLNRHNIEYDPKYVWD